MATIKLICKCSYCGKEYDNLEEAINCEKNCVRKSNGERCEYKIEKDIGIDPSRKYCWLEEDDAQDRTSYWFRQRNKYGFDERETWCLDYRIAAFLYPRFVKFKEWSGGSRPVTLSTQEWNDMLDKIIFGLKSYLLDEKEDSYLHYQDAMKLIAEHCYQFWW